MIILSHTIPSIELASYNIPIVTIEREDQYVSSVNTDNYMGGVQATSLLAKTGADILIHINADISRQTPSYERIQGFSDICKEYNIPHEIILTDTGQRQPVFWMRLQRKSSPMRKLQRTFLRIPVIVSFVEPI